MTQTPPGHDPQGAYQLGRMAEALSQNTVTLTKLVEAVDENSRSTARLANRQDRMEQTIEQMQADQRKMININMTGQSTEADLRKKFEWLDRKYQEEVSANGVKDHARRCFTVPFWSPCSGSCLPSSKMPPLQKLQRNSEIKPKFATGGSPCSH